MSEKLPLNVHGKERNTTTSVTQQRLQKLKDFFIKNFLPISLIFAVVFGALVPAPGVFLNHKVTVYICVAFMFLNSGLYLRTSAIKDALKAYRAYIWGIVNILGITCVVGGQLVKLLNFDKLPSHLSTNKTTMANDSNSLGPFEFKVGMILYASMPCTVASGVIMVSNLHGHFALAIMLTVITNVVAIFTIPFYVSWLVVSDIKIEFDVGSIMLKMFLTVFVPLMIGKLLRTNKKLRDFITVPSRKLILKMLSLSCLATVLLIKTSVSSQTGLLPKLTAVAAAVIVFFEIAVHVLFLIINTIAVFLLRLPLDQKKCIIILASQKTLAQAVAILVFLPPALGDKGLIALAMVFAHITILLFDSVLIPVWLSFEAYYEKKKQRKLEQCDINVGECNYGIDDKSEYQKEEST